MRIIVNAVPRTAVGGRYRGKCNSTLTKTYKRHLLTIMTSMGMIERTERTVKKEQKEVQKEVAESYVSIYTEH